MFLAFSPLRTLVQIVRRHPWRTLGVGLAGVVALGLGLHFLALLGYQRSELDLRQGNIVKAARNDLWLCRWVWPRDPETLLLAARIERIDGNFLAAEYYLNQRKAIQQGADSKTQLEWTLLRALSGGFDQAENGLWNAVDADDPDAPYVLETLAVCYIRRGLFRSAIDCLTRWLNLDPNSPRALDLRAFALSESQQYDDARKDLKALARLAPDNWKARRRYVSFLLEENNLDDALPHLEWLERNHGNDPEVLLNRARYHFIKRQFDDCRKVCLHILDLKPDYWQAMLQLAKLEYQIDNLPEAEKWARKALALEPARNDTQTQLYNILQAQPGREKEAQEQFQRMQQNQKDISIIRDLVTQHLEKDINNPEIYYKVGAAYLRLGDGKEGVLWLQKALARDPNHQATHELLAQYYQDHQQPELAAKHRKLARQ